MTRIVWFSALLLSLAGFLLTGQPAAGDCGAEEDLVPLARLAGHEGRIPAEGTPVATRGTVTGVFPGRNGLDGFFIQHDARERPVGLFVYAPAFTPADWARITPGARIHIEARAGEYRGRPQLQQVDVVTLCARGDLPQPVAMHLPADPDTLDALHGVLVQFPEPLTVTSNYALGRYGSLTLSAGGRLFRHQVTSEGLHRITLDDGSYRAGPEPIPYLDEHGTRRTGDTLDSLVGVLAHAFDDWRIHPLDEPAFRSANSRPPEPGPLPGLKVATFNLENYFLTLDQRGARSAAALERQRGKLLAALRAQDADLLALVEVENRPHALADLVQRLNATMPEADHYRVPDGPADAGSDAIRGALIYRPRTLELLGDASAAIHDTHDRPPVMAAFRNRVSGERFLASVVHFKSKSGCPPAGDVDQGQGCWNQRRTSQARALLQAVAEKSQAADNARILLAGDFNSYAAEDPIRILEEAGYRNPVAAHLPPERRYTYVFNGEAGMLDYIFTSPDLTGDVTGATVWHINADEPPFLSYDGRAGRLESSLNQPWRSSDHDPVIIGLER